MTTTTTITKFWTSLALLQTKALVNSYTWITLPFYALKQRPWHRIAQSNNLGVQSYIDRKGRTIYHRPSPLKNFDHPYLNLYTYNEIIPLLDRNKKIIGTRKVISEVPQIDPESGVPLKIDGRELKKVKLADNFDWLTVGQVLDHVDSLARGLQTLGLKTGEKVIIYADNVLEWFYSAIAAQRLNVTIVTLLSILSIMMFLNQQQ